MWGYRKGRLANPSATYRQEVGSLFGARHVCASLLIAPGASDVQVVHQMGHSKIETTKNIYGHLFAQDRALILDAMNQAVSLYAYENEEPGKGGGTMQLPERPPTEAASSTDCRAVKLMPLGLNAFELGGGTRT